MYISQPKSLTQMYVEVDSVENKYQGLINANFQDYMDSLAQSGELEIKSARLKQRIGGVIGAAGMAAGALGGPSGLALGFSIGNTIGKYLGNVVSNRIYGRAIADMADMVHNSKLRHTQLATSIMFNKKMYEAVDTLRQNENKRIKDAIQEMQV